MKAISLWQPWASLVALGHKRIETRHWPSGYRGPLAIHAAIEWSFDRRVALAEVNRVLLVAGLAALADPPRGAIVATCRLVGCVQSRGADRWPPLERAFGDLAEGRWAWRLADVRPLEFPVKCKGAQGLWDVPDELLPLLANGGDLPDQPSLFDAMEGRR